MSCLLLGRLPAVKHCSPWLLRVTLLTSSFCGECGLVLLPASGGIGYLPRAADTLPLPASPATLTETPRLPVTEHEGL